MAEVYNFLECEIYKCGTVANGTTPYSIDAYAENVTVAVNRNLADRIDDQGVVRDRVTLRTDVQMTIGKLYDARVNLFDGNDILLYMGNTLGTEKWQMTKCWLMTEDWGGGGEDSVAYNLTIAGNTFGTIA